MQNNTSAQDQVAAKAQAMAEKFALNQAAEQQKQQELFDRMNRTADSIMPILDGWTVAEVEVLLGQFVMAKLKEACTYSTPTK